MLHSNSGFTLPVEDSDSASPVEEEGAGAVKKKEIITPIWYSSLQLRILDNAVGSTFETIHELDGLEITCFPVLHMLPAYECNEILVLYT